MPEPAGFKCEQCGSSFMTPVLTEREKEELKREGKRGGPIQCRKCGSFKVVRV